MEREELAEEIWGDAGTRTWKTVSFSCSPLLRCGNDSVKRKTGGDGTQRQHDGQAPYPPPDLEGKVKQIYVDAERKGLM